MNVCSSKVLIQKIKFEPFYIYGAGRAAARLYNVLKNKKLLENFHGFVVSSNANNQDFDGKIYAVSNDNLNRKANVFISTHKVFLSEVIEALSNNGFSRYEWIYPTIFDLEYGEPVLIEQQRNVKQLVSNMRSKYMLALFYLAIENFLGKNDFGIDCHIKFHMSHVSRLTAEKIAKLFCKRIEDYLKTNELEPYPIMINSREDYCMDGNHKLILAYYFNVLSINCNVYAENDVINKLRDENSSAIKESYHEIRAFHTEREALAILDVMKKFEKAD